MIASWLVVVRLWYKRWVWVRWKLHKWQAGELMGDMQFFIPRYNPAQHLLLGCWFLIRSNIVYYNNKVISMLYFSYKVLVNIRLTDEWNEIKWSFACDLWFRPNLSSVDIAVLHLYVSLIIQTRPCCSVHPWLIKVYRCVAEIDWQESYETPPTSSINEIKCQIKTRAICWRCKSRTQT